MSIKVLKDFLIFFDELPEKAYNSRHSAGGAHICKGVEYTMKKLEEYVRSIPDFPEKGVIFRDVTSVLQDADGLHLAIETMQGLVKDLEVDVIAGPD